MAGDEVSMTAQLQFRDVTLGYDRHPAVHHLDGEVASGTLLAVVGPNGAGKSTLFRGIAGILKPLAGSIVTGDLDIRDIAYLPQARPRATRLRRRSPPSASTALRTVRSARCRAGRCSACCSRGCCCRTHG
jgi:ABC-type Mn2+/Zn2+ transport system ATPase subunit